jgi:hypothetical protein
MTVTLYVGDVSEELALQARAHDPAAFLIDHTNYQKFINDPVDSNAVAFTSLGDLPKNLKIFYDVCRRADKIVYAPPKTWSDGKTFDLLNPGDSLQGVTEYLLLMMSDDIEIVNIESAYLSKDPNPVMDSRRGTDPQLWFVGPSIVEGTGVDPKCRFGQLVADALELPASFITQDGASNTWGAGQILRSDLRAGDTVIWGLSITERVPLIMRGRLWHLQKQIYSDHEFLNDILSSDFLSSETNFFNNVYAIEQVTNFCNKCGVKLMMIGVLSVPNPNFLRYLRTNTNYYHYPYTLDFSEDKIIPTYIDLAPDNKHPGTQQHRHFADFILKNIKDSV